MRKLLLFVIMVLCISQAYAQKVTGKVFDPFGEPVVGASVIIKGTTDGTITDIDGNFTLEVKNRGSILTINYLGYVPQDVLVGNKTNIEVTLQESTLQLDELVVVGYGTQKKALITGANTNVKGDQIESMKQTSAMAGLQGLVPGLNITRNNGAPGSGTKVTIRGMGTIGNSSPLYIVDGIAVDNIDYLSPGDIESLDVLKDAASAAIYGSRAANGVVLVTTKKGKAGVGGNMETTVSYDGYYGVQNIYKNLSPLNAQEYIFINNEARANENLALFNWEDIVKNRNLYLNNTFGNNTGNIYGDYVWNKLEGGWKGTNWVEEMTDKDAAIQNHSINITGGSKSFKIAGGFSYFDQKGIIGGNIIDAAYKRMTARLNSELLVFKLDNGLEVFKVGQNLTYTNTKSKSVAAGDIYYNDLHNALTALPIAPAYWDNANINTWTGGFGPSLQGFTNDISNGNPLARMYFLRNNVWGNGNNIVGNVYGVLEPIRDLKLRSSFGLTAWWGNGRNYTPKYQLNQNFANLVDGVSQNMYEGSNITWTNTLTYQRIFNEKHNVSALIGTEMLKYVSATEMGASKINTLFGSGDYAYLSNTQNPTSVTDISAWGRDWGAQGGGIFSYMARVSYNYMEKYLLDATFRADASSNFAPDKRWGYFPSVSAGWIFSSEEFMKEQAWLGYGKLRASWGQNGNQNINNFVYLANIGQNPNGYYFGSNKEVPGLSAYPSNVPNPDVTWETSEQINVGIDLRFLNSRLSTSIDWYQKNTKDWLVVAPILGTFGAGAPYINGGDVRNSGLEALVSWNDNIQEVSYGITLSGAYNKNKVTRIANSEGIINGPSNVLSQNTSYIARVQEGFPIGYFYGYKTNGILQNQAEVNAYVGPDGKPMVIASEAGVGRKPGDVRFVDMNNDGIIDDKDKTKLGKPNPDFELGAQFNVEWKGIFVNAAFSGKFGMQVMQSYRSWSDKPWENYTTDIFNRWHGEGTSNKLPRLTYNSNANTNLISDIYMHNADYFRMNNLTVGYRFDKLLTRVPLLSGVSVYVSVNNLFTITGYNGMDPEVGYNGGTSWGGGVDLGLYPLPRTVMFGLSMILK
ncbi:MAG: SusC/RagA family TonB-linked outer membrane protein [Bacteroidales bacterium]